MFFSFVSRASCLYSRQLRSLLRKFPFYLPLFVSRTRRRVAAPAASSPLLLPAPSVYKVCASEREKLLYWVRTDGAAKTGSGRLELGNWGKGADARDGDIGRAPFSSLWLFFPRGDTASVLLADGEPLWRARLTGERVSFIIDERLATLQ